MPQWLKTSGPDFETAFSALLSKCREEKGDVDGVVAGILAAVKEAGDAAVIGYTDKFDRLKLSPENLRFSDEEISQARAACDPALVKIMEEAVSRVRVYHEKQMPSDLLYEDDAGVTLGYRWTAVQSAGLYVPGGTAALFSSVLMNAVPARVAGVSRLVATLPTPDGVTSPSMLTACSIAGIDEVFRIGGAQAIGALAYGTASINPVDVIVGPGNAYVASAKKQVYGTVGIDMIAGPSEVTVVADGQNNPDWIAADLLAQAEHDVSSQSILITDDAAFGERVNEAIDAQLVTLKREKTARASWDQHGAIIVVETLDQAIGLVDLIAPEHLELAVENPDTLSDRIRNAGAIFLGRHTPEAIGDYIAGPSHVLPTSGTARFSSGLSVMDFLKRTSLIGCTADSLRSVAHSAVTMADAEDLSAHARSVSIRLNME
ncbi:MAG: histidinol dehydrogenase [Rhodospirillaceae bacterium]|jgi:histidinol dehydrogenase|nr:histidinol dehydrogenase [Rhodospirillaceae bacterium]